MDTGDVGGDELPPDLGIADAQGKLRNMDRVTLTNKSGVIGGDELPPGFGVVKARPKRKTEKTALPLNYEPSKYSVICGRGKGSYQRSLYFAECFAC